MSILPLISSYSNDFSKFLETSPRSLTVIILVVIYSVIGKLSKFSRKENNTDILLYQIYLPKSHENILKYDR